MFVDDQDDSLQTAPSLTLFEVAFLGRVGRMNPRE
jgi:hypothetical protein